MADLAGKLDEIVEAVETARALPLSASCVVHRGELLDALAELRDLLPQEVRDARAVLGARAGVVAEGRAEAERVLAEAEAERDRLVSRSAVTQHARAQAEELLAAAREEAVQLRHEADDYVDSKLATFEVVLRKTLAQVDRGRERLRGTTETDVLAPAEQGPGDSSGALLIGDLSDLAGGAASEPGP